MTIQKLKKVHAAYSEALGAEHKTTKQIAAVLEIDDDGVAGAMLERLSVSSTATETIALAAVKKRELARLSTLSPDSVIVLEAWHEPGSAKANDNSGIAYHARVEFQLDTFDGVRLIVPSNSRRWKGLDWFKASARVLGHLQAIKAQPNLVQAQFEGNTADPATIRAALLADALKGASR